MVNNNGRSCNLTLYVKVQDLCINNSSIISPLEAMNICLLALHSSHSNIEMSTIEQLLEKFKDIVILVSSLYSLSPPWHSIVVPDLDGKVEEHVETTSSMVCSSSRMICFSNTEIYTSHVVSQERVLRVLRPCHVSFKLLVK